VFDKDEFYSEVFQAYTPGIKSTLIFVCTDTTLAPALESLAERRDLFGQRIMSPSCPTSTTLFGQPEQTEEKITTTVGVWYFAPHVCDKMRAADVLNRCHANLAATKGPDAKRKKNSSLSMDVDAPDDQQDASLQKAIERALNSLWDDKANFLDQFSQILAKVPKSFELAHLSSTCGFQDAVFLTPEALKALLTPTNYDALVTKHQSVTLCQSYNHTYAAPLVSTQDTGTIDDLLLLFPDPSSICPLVILTLDV
jgi:hypothetical protein